VSRLLLDDGFLEVGGSFGLGSLADLNVINHLRGTGSLRHTGSRALVLHHARRAFPGHDAMLHMVFEAVFADFGLRKLRFDLYIDLSIRNGRLVLDSRRARCRCAPTGNGNS